jgi:hypothetical protein
MPTYTYTVTWEGPTSSLPVVVTGTLQAPHVKAAAKAALVDAEAGLPDGVIWYDLQVHVRQDGVAQ